jgi:hypothetical protein
VDGACTGRSASLPILTFDEATLSPSLGYVFDRRCVEPFESVVSILWKFSRMNGLPGHVLVRHLSSAPLDPYDGIGVSTADVDVRLVARMLGVPMKTVRAGLSSPCTRRKLDTRLRHCPRCMSLGYHGMVHQFLGAMQCPAHGDWLQEHCRLATIRLAAARIVDAGQLPLVRANERLSPRCSAARRAVPLRRVSASVRSVTDDQHSAVAGAHANLHHARFSELTCTRWTRLGDGARKGHICFARRVDHRDGTHLFRKSPKAQAACGFAHRHLHRAGAVGHICCTDGTHLLFSTDERAVQRAAARTASARTKAASTRKPRA